MDIKTKIQTLADAHQLCGALNWVRPWLGLTTEDLAPLFDLLKGREELSSRALTSEAQKALEKVQVTMSTRQANRCNPDPPFQFIILGKLLHLHGVIFQWNEKEGNTSKKDLDRKDPLLIRVGFPEPPEIQENDSASRINSGTNPLKVESQNPNKGTSRL